MSVSDCEYCDARAQVTLGELWLCDHHGHALEDQAGGLAQLLEMSPEGRRAMADMLLPRVVREDVSEPSGARED
jgi:hypothetical protein